MKHLLLSLLFVGTFSTNFAQETYDDLIIYFADGDYEKLVDKAEKYMDKDDSKNDPQPYLWSAKANFEMSKDQKYDEDFPKAFNDAISDAGKALKKDKENTIFDEHKAFYTDLKVAVVEDIKNQIEGGEYSRLRGSVFRLQRLDPTDIGSYYLLTAAYYQIKDKGSAKNSLKEGEALLNEVESIEDWRDIDKEVLRIGVLEYVNYLVGIRQIDKARDMLGQVKQWYEDDDIFMATYNDVVN